MFESCVLALEKGRERRDRGELSFSRCRLDCNHGANETDNMMEIGMVMMIAMVITIQAVILMMNV